MSTNPLLQALGYSAGARLVIFHADDLGSLHSANQAYDDLRAAGVVRAGSIMIPAPWCEEIVRAGVAQPAFDLGIHLTLNSELHGCRWRPLTTHDPADGLVDCDGWFWARREPVARRLNVHAAVAEMHAQVEYAFRNGLDFTHIDAHMGTALGGPLLDPYIALGLEYKVPFLLPRNLDEYTRPMLLAGMRADAWRGRVRTLEAQGMPLVDTLRVTPGYDPMQSPGGSADVYEAILRNLPSGITYFAIHPNVPGAEVEAARPDAYQWHVFEHAYFQSQRLRDFLAAEGIVPIGLREIRTVMRETMRRREGGPRP